MSVFKSKFPKINSDLKSILYNRWVLYFISFLAIADFIYLCSSKKWPSAVIFASVGFLVSQFNKNMIVVFSIAMAVTHVLEYGIKGSRVHEGFEEEEKEGFEEEEKEGFEEEEKEGFENSAESDLKHDAVVKGEENDVKKVDSEKPVISKKEEDKELSREKKEREKNIKKDDKTEEKSKMEKFIELKKDLPEFKEIQKEILSGVDKMTPLLTKAENFIEKFNDYKMTKK